MKRLIPIVSGQVAFLVFGLASVKIISHLVSPDVYGLYALFLTLVQIGPLLTHGGLFNYATRFWHREDRDRGEFSRFLWQMNLAGMRGTAVLLLGALGILAVLDRDPHWLLLLPFLLEVNVALTTNAIANGVLAVDDRRWLIFGLSFAGNAVRTFMPAIAVLLAGATLISLAAGYALYAALLMTATLLVFRDCWSARPAAGDRQAVWIKELLTYGRPYFWMGVGTWCLQSADRWVVLNFFGDEKAGLFALAGNLGLTVPGMVATSMLQLVFPRVFRDADKASTMADWQRMARYCDWLTLAFLFACMVGIGLLTALGPRLVGVLIDRKYEAAMALLLPVGMSAVSIQVNQFYYLLLQGQQNNHAMVRVMLVVSGVKTVGSLIAAWISWDAFLAWLGISMVFSAVIGRKMIRHLVFHGGWVPPALEVKK